MNGCFLTGRNKKKVREGKLVSLGKDNKPRGTYTLLVHIRSATAVQVGRLGTVHLQPGYYIYVGSALGPGGLPSRVHRHLRPNKEKRPHWHIDALTALGVIEEVWWVESGTRQECALASVLTKVGKLAVAGFGASDCRCPGHLVWLDDAEGVVQGWCESRKFLGSRMHRVRMGSTPTVGNLMKIGADR